MADNKRKETDRPPVLVASSICQLQFSATSVHNYCRRRCFQIHRSITADPLERSEPYVFTHRLKMA